MTNRAIAICQKHSGFPCIPKAGSTDCNVPMSLGIPAIAFGCKQGEGAHTRAEKVRISSLPIGIKIAAEMILGYFNE